MIGCPKISIIITSFNQKDYLKDSLNSALNQTLQAHEIIIIDDSSSDGSVEIIKSYKDEYPDIIIPVYNTLNKGVSKVRNQALELITGDYFTFLDGDDIFLPDKLKIEYQAISSENDIGFVFSNFYFTDSNGIIQGNWAEVGFSKSNDFFVQTICLEFPGMCPFRSELVRTSLLKIIGDFDEKLVIWEDFDFRIRLAHASTKTVYINRPLSNYRRHSDGLSSRAEYNVGAIFEYIYLKYKPIVDHLPKVQAGYFIKRYNYLQRLFSFNYYFTILKNNPRNISLRIKLLSLLFRSVKEKPLCLFLKYFLIIVIPSLLYRPITEKTGN